MSESDDSDVVEAIMNNLRNAKGSVDVKLAEIDEGTREAIDEAVSVASKKSQSIGDAVGDLGTDSQEVLYEVTESIEDHISGHDFEITLSENKIHIKGDDEGLEKLEADLKDIGKVDYQRESGLEIHFK
jgi:hypothetical protein